MLDKELSATKISKSSVAKFNGGLGLKNVNKLRSVDNLSQLSNMARDRQATTTRSVNRIEAPLILLIESHEGVRQMIVRFLECNGYAVAGVCIASHALTLVAQRTPDLILCDINPFDPDIACFHALCGTCPQTPIIAMSAGGDSEEISSIYFEGWLSKPFDMHHLLHLIESGLRLERNIGPCR